MSLGEEWISDHLFEIDFPFGLPGDTWETKDGRVLRLTEMTEQHIRNCMRMVGNHDPWYERFSMELKRRAKNEL